MKICITGHRDIPEDKIGYVTDQLRIELEKAIQDGATHFLSGFAKGADMIFARLVIELKEEHPQITLEAALPYGTWFKNRSAEDKALLNKCAVVGVHSQTYHPECFLVRNRFMVGESQRVIAVYDGRLKGGTVSTIRYASALGREVRTIRI